MQSRGQCGGKSVGRDIQGWVQESKKRTRVASVREARKVEGKFSGGKGGHVATNKDEAMGGNRIAVERAVDKLRRNMPGREGVCESGYMRWARDGQRGYMEQDNKAL